ncbi:MAG: hypothetical protein IKO15_03245, partial [Clostridiales bacterium]|nr:hypothetical protein [Clostridiales bacterium]
AASFGSRVAETKNKFNANLGLFLTSCNVLFTEFLSYIHNKIIIEDLQYQLCQNALIFGANSGRKYANQQFDLPSIISPEASCNRL